MIIIIIKIKINKQTNKKNKKNILTNTKVRKIVTTTAQNTKISPNSPARKPPGDSPPP